MTEDFIADEYSDPLSDYEPAEYSSEIRRVLAEGCVMDMQVQPHAEVSSKTTIGDAVRVLHDLKISSLLVVDDGKLVGIFTERDVLEKVAEQFTKMADLPVSEVMVVDPIVVYESDPVAAALAAIAVGGYRHVPVLSLAGEVLGVMSPRRVNCFLQQRFLDELNYASE